MTAAELQRRKYIGGRTSSGKTCAFVHRRKKHVRNVRRDVIFVRIGGKHEACEQNTYRVVIMFDGTPESAKQKKNEGDMCSLKLNQSKTLDRHFTMIAVAYQCGTRVLSRYGCVTSRPRCKVRRQSSTQP